MTSLLSLRGAFSSREQVLSEGESSILPPACLALLRTLEVSLQNSQKALLARDVGHLEELTREQLRLRALLTLARAENENLAGAETSTNPEPAAAMRAAAKRVMHLGRIQQALLDRAQRSLRTLSHRIAGVSATYNPLPPNQGKALPRNRTSVQKG